MAQLKIERIKEQELNFTYKIYVDKEGQFSTTLPPDIVEIFQGVGIELKQNRMRKSGFFISDTYEGLKNNIKDIIREYYSKETIETKIVIRYVIQTTCLYCLDVDGNIVPNGQRYWTKTDSYAWRDGTVEQHATKPQPFGFSVYARSYQKETNKFKSGKIKSEYYPIDKEVKEGVYLHWLNSFASISPPCNEMVKEIDYTEEAAEFFVNLLTSVCQLNEKIKDFLSPDKIIKIIENKQKLLS